jgi:sarcosine oxidase subunit beta
LPELKTEVVVVGGGLIGSSITYYLSKQGIDVTLLEKSGICLETSGACSGTCFVQSKKPGPTLRLTLKGLQEYEILRKELSYPLEFRQTGAMILIENNYELELMEKFVHSQRENGLDVKIISVKEAREKCPSLTENIVGTTYSPLDWQIDPLNLNVGLIEGAKNNGATIMLGVSAEKIGIKNAEIAHVETNDGTKITTDFVVNAAGVHAQRVGAMIDVNAPVMPKRGQIIVTEKLPPLLPIPMMDVKYIMAKLRPSSSKETASKPEKLDVGLAIEQTMAGTILSGSTRELVGYDTNVSFQAITAIARNMLRYLPVLENFAMIRAFSGLRPYTPDGYPIIGQATNVKGFVIAAGHEGDGVALAPITGRIVSEIIAKGEPSFPIDEFSPARFNEKRLS